MRNFLRPISKIAFNKKTEFNVPSYISRRSAPSYIASVAAYETAKQALQANNLEKAEQFIRDALEKSVGICDESPATVSYVLTLLEFKREIEQRSTLNKTDDLIRPKSV